MTTLARLAALLAAALLLGACGQNPSPSVASLVEPSEGRSGLYLSGTVAGHHLAVSDGAPRLTVGDCDPQDGRDDDVCFVSRDIDGTLFVLVFENPAVLVAGEVVPVADSSCRGRACNDVTDHAVVDVGIGPGRRSRASGGSVTAKTIEELFRYRGSLNVEVPGGRFSGDFNVVPRPNV